MPHTKNKQNKTFFKKWESTAAAGHEQMLPAECPNVVEYAQAFYTDSNTTSELRERWNHFLRLIVHSSSHR